EAKQQQQKNIEINKENWKNQASAKLDGQKRTVESAPLENLQRMRRPASWHKEVAENPDVFREALKQELQSRFDAAHNPPPRSKPRPVRSQEQVQKEIAEGQRQQQENVEINKENWKIQA